MLEEGIRRRTDPPLAETAKSVTPYSGARFLLTRPAKMGTALTAFPLGRAGAIFATRLAKGVTAAFCRRGFCSLASSGSLDRSSDGRTGDHSFRVVRFGRLTSSASSSGVVFCAVDGIETCAQSGFSVKQTRTFSRKVHILLIVLDFEKISSAGGGRRLELEPAGIRDSPANGFELQEKSERSRHGFLNSKERSLPPTRKFTKKERATLLRLDR